MDDVRISALIPTYNRAELVVRAVDNALAQTRPPDEVVVVDDGSTDDTRRRVGAFGSLVRYVYQANAGGAAARNTGVREAAHEWVAFLDSDDTWKPDHLERMERAIRATRGRAGFYFSDTILAPRGGTPSSVFEEAGFTVRGAHEVALDATGWATMRIQPMMLQSSVFSREAYLRAGGLRESLIRRHDTHLFFVLSIGLPVCAVDGCGSVMTADDDSPTRLTVGFDEKSRIYWESTVALYDDVTRRFPNVSGDARRSLRVEQSVGHWRLARLAMKERRWTEVVRHLVSSARADFLGFLLRPLGLSNR